MHVIISESALLIHELSCLVAPSKGVGGVNSFTGYMRDNNLDRNVNAMFLDHYPGMTESALARIIEQAKNRWPIIDGVVAHRVGKVVPGDLLVYVEVQTAHRQCAFDACNFIMDTLKTTAPFWKKELTNEGEFWVEQRDSDVIALDKWQQREN